MKINKTGRRRRSDLINGISTLTYDGVLNVVCSGRPLASGDSFRLFNATNYLGKFDGITPASPGDGLAWDVSGFTLDGTLQVKSASPAKRN